MAGAWRRGAAMPPSRRGGSTGATAADLQKILKEETPDPLTFAGGLDSSTLDTSYLSTKTPICNIYCRVYRG